MKKTITDKNKIEELLTRGAEEVIEKDHLRKRLLSGEVLRIKLGIDPTGPKIHLGRATQLLKLRDFQNLGHKIILIIGDFTAQIGDASDKNSARRPLTEDEVKENMKNYLPQIGKILDLKKAEVYYNSQWLNRLTVKNLLLIAMQFTAQQMIQRRNFKERWEAGNPIGLHELYYPLFQGYDSVAIRADVEIGGSDQLFNLKTGRIVQQFFGQKPQDVMTLKMVYGLDGRKMSTTWGNVINIEEPPKEMYGKVMSMHDELIFDYFETCTRVPLKEIKQMREALKSKKVNPKEIKSRLAKEIVAIFWGEKEADEAQIEFEKIFKEKRMPENVPVIKIKEEKLDILELLNRTGLVNSKTQAKRLIGEKGVKIVEGSKKHIIQNWTEDVSIKDGLVVQVGKRRFVKIKKEK